MIANVSRCTIGQHTVRYALSYNVRRRCLASSALPDFDGFVPNIVRDAVKSSVISQVTKREVKNGSVNGVSGMANNHVSNNNINSSHIRRNDNESRTTITSSSHYQQTQTDIDTPLSPIGEDPLMEWHLNSTPTYISPPSIAPLSNATDPFVLAAPDTEMLSSSIRNHLIKADHPVLNRAAAHFFSPDSSPGKMIRPTMVFLLSKTLNSNISSSDMSSELNSDFTPTINPSQRRLAEIAEMIHTASLFHDDVLDESDTRRGNPTVHTKYGNKVAILAGDFLLARASRALARLRDVMVMETMSLIIDHLIQGEVMQIRPLSDKHHNNSDDEETRMEYYLRKNFFKTGSLMAQSCMSTAILSSPDCHHDTVDACYRYGKHVGLAFQLVDDVLDFEGDQETMGKPKLSDLTAGLATAPVLYTLDDDTSALSRHERDELETMVARKFRGEGDVERACVLVESGDGIQRTKDLAQVHAELAIRAVMELDVTSSDANKDHRDALVHLATKVVDRTR